MAEEDDPLLGRTLGGKYRLDALIGRGGFGAVYRAVQHPLGHTVAVKVLMRNDGPGRGAMRDRFFREGRALTRLRGRSCVVMHDFSEEPDGLLYMVQELLDGRTLTRALAEGEAFPPSRIAHIGGQILDALDEAHGLGIVHRDIKPDNVMLVAGRDGEEVRVLDFGIAKVLDPADDPEGGTSTGHLVGTPAYMAPEQALQRAIGPAVDLYALGVVLYQLAVGQVPFGGRSTFEILRRHVENPPPNLGAVSPALRSVIGRALSKAPEDRYRSAREMAVALRAAGEADGETHTAPRLSGDLATAPTAAVDGLDETAAAIGTGPAVDGLGETGALPVSRAEAAVGSTTDETRGAVDVAPSTTVDLEAPVERRSALPLLALLVLVGLGAIGWLLVSRPDPRPGPVTVGVAGSDATLTLKVAPAPDAAVAAKPPTLALPPGARAVDPARVGITPSVPSPRPVTIGVVPTRVYRARLSARDHHNSRGVPLTTAADVIRQDRANVHRYGVRDPDDQLDGLYGDKDRRAALRERLDIDVFTARVIMEGTPLVEVRTTDAAVEVRLIE